MPADTGWNGRRLVVVGAAVLLLITSCNAVFDIHEGTPRPMCPDQFMIDDLEDGDEWICKTAGRSGPWYVVGDGTSTDLRFAPALIEGERGSSRYAMHFSGAGFTGWGALLGFNLNKEELALGTVNASTAAGVKFWLKSDTPVRVTVLIPATIDRRFGGDCFQSENCSAHFGFELSAPGRDWTEYEVPFSALVQWGTAIWDPHALAGIELVVPADAPFDVWVDDIQFYNACALDDCLPTCSDPAFPKACPERPGVPARCIAPGGECGKLPVCSDPAFPKACAERPDRPPSCVPDGGDCSEVVSSDLLDVWGTGSRDVWVLGDKGTIAHWDGSAWAVVGAGTTTKFLESAWGSGPDDVWAVGEAGTILHWDGAAWSPVTSGTSVRLESVWGSGPDDVWAVGEAGTILHWDDAAWSPFASGTSYDFIGNVWGSSPDDVWAVGIAAVVDHWNGSAWSPARAAPRIVVLLGLWGSGPDDVWAVGGDGGSDADPPSQGENVVHWDGSAWFASSSGTAQPLYGLWGSGPSDMWAVGSKGTIRRWNGSAWLASASGTTQQLYDVWGSGPADAWAVGVEGTLLHWNGSTWSRQSIPKP